MVKDPQNAFEPSEVSPAPSEARALLFVARAMLRTEEKPLHRHSSEMLRVITGLASANTRS